MNTKESDTRIISIKELCDKYHITRATREKAGFVDDQVEIIDKIEYDSLKEKLTKQRINKLPPIIPITKRKYESIEESSRLQKTVKPSPAVDTTLSLSQLESLDGDTMPNEWGANKEVEAKPSIIISSDEYSDSFQAHDAQLDMNAWTFDANPRHQTILESDDFIYDSSPVPFIPISD